MLNLKDHAMKQPAQAPKALTVEDIKLVIAMVTFPGYTFHVVSLLDGAVVYLQASFLAPCAITGAMGEQRTRKWLLSLHMTVSELVQTALKCVLTSVEHEAREAFRWRGEAVFGPHLDVVQTWALCATDRAQLDVRPPPPEPPPPKGDTAPVSAADQAVTHSTAPSPERCRDVEDQ